MVNWQMLGNFLMIIRAADMPEPIFLTVLESAQGDLSNGTHLLCIFNRKNFGLWGGLKASMSGADQGAAPGELKFFLAPGTPVGGSPLSVDYSSAWLQQ